MTDQKLSALRKAAATIGRLNARIESLESEHTDPIAIVGLACRGPGAENADQLWEMISDGQHGISDVPASRWDVNKNFDPRPGVPGKSCTRKGGFIDGVSEFDAEFFNISSREAEGMDPQQRILLECAWHCFEDAGIKPSTQQGQSCGVFVGVTATDYGMLQASTDSSDEVNPYFNTGTPQNVCAGRISYVFGLEGPSMAVDTACSSSLTAIHLACQSLRAGDCETAIAGGVNLTLTPLLYSTLSAAGMLSVDGFCKPFDNEANGYARGEGCGLIILKRLSNAEKDGDNILGIIRGSTLNQDGASSGLTVPNGVAQKNLIKKTLDRSHTRPEEINYVEAHGTGTPLGDPIEVRALGRALASSRIANDPLLIGSIKSNIGHLESAAGAFSVIKVLMALQHEMLPPTLHISELNGELDWASLNIKPVTSPTPWLKNKDRKRVASVSGFGASGSNAHLIIEEAPETNDQKINAQLPRNPVLAFSARSELSLRRLAQKYADLTESANSEQIAAIACASVTRRESLTFRAAIAVQDKNKLSVALSQLANGQSMTVGIGPLVAKRDHNVAFIFSGQGDVFPGMGMGLYQEYPVYRAAIDECATLLGASLGQDLLSILSPENTQLVEKPIWSQAALFCIQYALTRLWDSVGLKPTAVAGHSIGEFAASVAAGAVPLSAALDAIVIRAELMEGLPDRGGMSVVLADRPTLQKALSDLGNPPISIAVENGPANFVVSGDQESLLELKKLLAKINVRCHPLSVTHAFHSKLMDPLLDDFEHKITERFGSARPSTSYFSSLEGRRLDRTSSLDGNYWRRHCRQPVLFAPTINAMLESGITCFIEIGPATTIAGLIKQVSPQALTISSLPSRETSGLESAMAKAWANGIAIHWEGLPFHEPRPNVSLPLYPFNRRPYWLKKIEQADQQSSIEIDDMTINKNSAARLEEVLTKLLTIFSTLLRVPEESIDADAQLIEMGADSLILVSGVNTIENEFGLKLEIQQLFEEVTSLSAIAAYIVTNTTAPDVDIEISRPVNTAVEASENKNMRTSAPSQPVEFFGSELSEMSNGDSSDLTKLIAAQTQLMARHLELLQGTNNVPQQTVVRSKNVELNTSPVPTASDSSNTDRSSPLRALNKPISKTSSLTTEQQKHMDQLMERYLNKTTESKRLAQACRSQLADSRASVGFRFSTKEVLYPITGTDSTGSRIIDVDGNEYVDLTMGFGVLLFGNKPSHMNGTLEEELSHGFQLGPRSVVMHEVASLFCELTHKERVAFTNSGTEAVMTALRLARAATKRDKIVIFEGAYNGHSDGTLAKRVKDQNGVWRSEPVSPGIPQNVASDCIVVEYGSDESLEIIRQSAGEIGAVLVEPVPSRNLEQQPVDFLRKLRALTHDLDIALIFDEMITGFRVDPAGVQGLWGIEADLATYGKILGGGTPIGAVAGRSRFMDGIDGGMWQYGDDSYPSAQRTYFGGTFCQHPVSMAGCLATLRELKAQGPALQQNLNNRMKVFADRVNTFFEGESLQLRIVFFGSIFTFRGPGNLEVFFYHLLEKGVYIWEWRACFLSTSHTDEDLDKVYTAIKDSIIEMRSGGFFPPIEKSQKKTLPIVNEQKPAHRANFSFYFFGNYDARYSKEKYDLVIAASKHGDKQGYEAVWLPERHFDRFGGFSPNPSVLAAALARETTSIKIRGGSVVLPLHHPLRVAEEWALVDNLSNGRTGIAFASGWHPNDFALAPENFEQNKAVTFKNIEVVRQLWSGKSVTFKDGTGKKVDLSIFPQPKQSVLPGWLTVVANPETYEKAAELGLGVLTNLLGQSVEELEQNLSLFKKAWLKHGRDPKDIQIAVLLHTYIEADATQAIETARKPLTDYLLASMKLFQKMAEALPEHLRDIDKVSETDRAFIINRAFERYISERALIGSPSTCASMVERLIALGVTEIGCFLDFGVSDEQVLENLSSIDQLRTQFQSNQDNFTPSSDAQRQLCLLSALDHEGNAAYMDPAIIDWRGPLDSDLLQTILQALVGRHESLRSNIVENGTILDIHSNYAVDLEQQSFESEENPESAADQWLKAELSKGVDLSKDRLFRPVVLKLRENEFLVAFLSHHAISDGPSMGMLIEELAECYNSMVNTGGLPELKKAKDFSAYVLELNQQRNTPRMQSSANYWRGTLAPLPTPLDLPFDYPRQDVRTWNGDRLVVQSSGKLVSDLKVFAKQQNATPYMLLHATFAALLHRWSGKNDLIIGAASAGRSEIKQSMVGYAVHLLPVRSRIDQHTTQKSFISKTIKTLLDSYSHQAYPFAWLFDDLEIPRDAARPPLVSVIFNYERLPDHYKIGAAEIRPRLAPVTHSRVDLTFTVNHIGERLELVADYNSDLFAGKTILRLLKSFEYFIEQFSQTVDRPLNELPLLSLSDYEMSIREWNNSPSAPPFIPVSTLIEAKSGANPDEPAVRVLGNKDSDLTFKELTTKANYLGQKLIDLGLKPNQRVGILLNSSPSQVVALLACLKLGCPYVPLDPDYPREHLQFIVDDAQIALLVTNDKNQQSIDLKAPLILKTEDLDVNQVANALSTWPSPAALNIAYIIYTSGSTGKPKGVEVTHQGLSNYVQWASRAYDADHGDGAPIICSLGFDASVTSVYPPLISGKPTVLVPAENETQSLQNLAKSSENFSFFKLTPAHLEILNRFRRADSNHKIKLVKHLILGGEALSGAHLQTWLDGSQNSVTAINEYGPTEATVGCCVHAIQKPYQGNVPIGTPIQGVQLFILDETLLPVLPGMPGELYIGGVGLAQGYLNRPAITAERFIPNPFGSYFDQAGGRLYKTGDLVRESAEGPLEFLGRTDSQVKVNGFRIEPGEIEAAILEHPKVVQTAVIKRSLSEKTTGLVAFVQPMESSQLQMSEFRDWLSARLPQHLIPTRFEISDVIPLSPNGKIDRSALSNIDLKENTVVSINTVSIKSKVEQEIAQVWQKVLGRDVINASDNFFDLGGTSIQIIDAHAQLASLLPKGSEVIELFRHPTISSLASFVEDTPKPNLGSEKTRRRAEKQLSARRRFRS
ncbi:MAG: amino acid adenylation domain-containing protein [Proteobacteria bacterium]|nr:amino acid adenylation domain-containing protein [Pseudomonadota bacterium]